MILIGIGSNLHSPAFGPPRETCAAALEDLGREGLRVVRRSRWYESAPVPPSDQPWFVNGVAAVEGDFDPGALLGLLNRIEERFGRVRRVRNEARILDLDLLAFDDIVRTGPQPPLLPHPRLQTRAFVLLPLAEIAPDWCHPVLGRGLAALIAELPEDQVARPL